GSARSAANTGWDRFWNRNLTFPPPAPYDRADAVESLMGGGHVEAGGAGECPPPKEAPHEEACQVRRSAGRARRRSPRRRGGRRPDDRTEEGAGDECQGHDRLHGRDRRRAV